MNETTGKKLTLSEVKDRLTNYGISTATPDMTGEPRYQELLLRLQNHEKSLNSTKSVSEKVVPTSSVDHTLKSETLESHSSDTSSSGVTLSSLKSLTLSEIKAKLTLYGEVSSSLKCIYSLYSNLGVYVTSVEIIN